MASSAISDIVERVRSNVTSAHIENVHNLLHLSRIINPLKNLFEKSETVLRVLMVKVTDANVSDNQIAIELLTEVFDWYIIPIRNP